MNRPQRYKPVQTGELAATLLAGADEQVALCVVNRRGRASQSQAQSRPLATPFLTNNGPGIFLPDAHAG